MLARILPGVRVLLVTFWVGSLWTVGYLAAPTLFATLPDRALAGSIAGSLFRVQAWVSVGCGLLLLLLFLDHYDISEQRNYNLFYLFQMQLMEVIITRIRMMKSYFLNHLI